MFNHFVLSWSVKTSSSYRKSLCYVVAYNFFIKHECIRDELRNSLALSLHKVWTDTMLILNFIIEILRNSLNDFSWQVTDNDNKIFKTKWWTNRTRSPNIIIKVQEWSIVLLTLKWIMHKLVFYLFDMTYIHGCSTLDLIQELIYVNYKVGWSICWFRFCKEVQLIHVTKLLVVR